VLVVSAVVAGACSSSIDVGVDGVDARWIDVGGPGDRRALLVTDEDVADEGSGGAAASAAAPAVVVVLHGLGQDAEHMATVGGWAQLAREGTVVVFADGWDHSWDAGTCCGKAATRKVDDVAYLDRLIGDVVTRTDADPDAVHMVGFSNGGMMTYRYLCEGEVRLKGAASIAGTDVDGCTPDRPTTFIQISGSADTIVPLYDTPSAAPELGPLEPVSTSVRGIAAAFGCPNPKLGRTGPVTTTLWAPCAEGVTVRFDVVAGMPHAYPIVDGYQGTDQILQLWGLQPAPSGG
jgi:polyhydroxybutyrate depolymerase